MNRIAKRKETFVLTAQAVRAAERAVMDTGISEDELIERAAAAVVSRLYGVCAGKYTLIVCGEGNNGSDGLSVALLLREKGCSVGVRLIGDKPGAENAKRRALVRSAGLMEDQASGARPEIVIDALFGIGLSRPVAGTYLRAIHDINALQTYTVSLDIPSGLHADTGTVMGAAVRADRTITFAAVKRGLILGDGLNYSGKIEVVDIEINTMSDILLTDCLYLRPRERISHKGTYGRVFIIAGTPDMPGAALLAAGGALRAGAGYVTMCVPDSMKAVFAGLIPEATLFGLPDAGGIASYEKSALDEIMRRADSILIGNGMGQNPALPQMLRYLSSRFDGTLVIDADGLNALAAVPDCIGPSAGARILTPHLGELYRLTENTGDVTADAARLAEKYGCVVAAKSAYTVITDGNAVYWNISGCAGMAKGGSGDTLAGIIAALANNGTALEAAALGCYRFGLAGESAERLCGGEGVTATKIAESLRFS